MDEPASGKKDQNWWKTLPGILTAVATFITAVGGFFVALNQANLIHSNPSPTPTATPVANNTPAHSENPGAARVQGENAQRDEAHKLMDSVLGFMSPDPNKVQSIRSALLVETQVLVFPNGNQDRLSIEDLTVIGQSEVIRGSPGTRDEVRSVTTRSEGFTVINGKVTESDERSQQKGLNSLKRDFFFVLQNINEPTKVNFNLSGEEDIRGISAKVLTINSDGSEFQWFVDPTSGSVMRMKYLEYGEKGVAFRFDIDYFDWRLTDGIRLPFRRVYSRETNTNPAISTEVTEVNAVHFNPPVDAVLFARP
jgi:hypothetical protein